ncbi:cysteine proteinase inhibitor 12-like isoform X1 [Diospyros lotus]|uniref:cysteine proteinase inhibitor 12-like isoform X1 n=1 Tax=Diospyros lotus TaxID=55363 RepID=UPI0022545E30|nr:cysteine proteinase inhibitor 12-like isoform X1 [Diospyros lotus]
MKLNNKDTNLVVSWIIAVALLCAFCELGFCREDDRLIKMKTLGGVHDCKGMKNSAEMESIGRFAVQEYNKKQNALLEFGRVVKAKEQVVAGKIYHLTLEATDAGKRKIYEAKVWVKPWINFKQLQEFKHAHDGPSFTSADLGVKRGWQKVPTFDQVIQRAALHAVKTIQQRSNSLLPYQLLDILLAEAEVIEDSTKFSMLLKVLRESKEEKFKVIVTKYIEGKFYVNQMEQGHS